MLRPAARELSPKRIVIAAVSEADVRRIARLRVGEALWTERLNAAAQAVALQMAEDGYLEALVTGDAVPSATGTIASRIGGGTIGDASGPVRECGTVPAASRRPWRRGSPGVRCDQISKETPSRDPRQRVRRVLGWRCHFGLA